MKMLIISLLTILMTFEVFATSTNEYRYNPSAQPHLDICIECEKITKFTKDHLNILNIIKASTHQIVSNVENLEKMQALTQDIIQKTKCNCLENGIADILSSQSENVIIPKNFSLSFDESLDLSSETLSELKIERGKERVYLTKVMLNGSDAIIRINIDSAGKTSVQWYTLKPNSANAPTLSLPDLPTSTRESITSSITPSLSPQKDVLTITHQISAKVGDNNSSGEIGATTTVDSVTAKLNTTIQAQASTQGENYSARVEANKSVTNPSQAMSASGEVKNENITLSGKISKSTDELGNKVVQNKASLVLGTKDCNASAEHSKTSSNFTNQSTRALGATCSISDNKFTLSRVDTSSSTQSSSTLTGLVSAKDIYGHGYTLGLSQTTDSSGKKYNEAHALFEDPTYSAGATITRTPAGTSSSVQASIKKSDLEISAGIRKDQNGTTTFFAVKIVMRGSSNLKNIYECPNDFKGEPEESNLCKRVFNRKQCKAKETCLALFNDQPAD